MKNAVKLINGYLESNNLLWEQNIVFDPHMMKYRKATDKDFDGNKINIIPIISPKKKHLYAILVTENMFLIFDKDRTEMKSNFTCGWKEYQAQMANGGLEKKQETAKFNKYIDEEKYDK